MRTSPEPGCLQELGWAGLGRDATPFVRLDRSWALGGRVQGAASSRARAERRVHALRGHCEPVVLPPPPRSRPVTEPPNFPQLAPCRRSPERPLLLIGQRPSLLCWSPHPGGRLSGLWEFQVAPVPGKRSQCQFPCSLQNYNQSSKSPR